MASRIAARCKETTTTTGTGTLQLNGAPSGYQTFLTAFGNGNRCHYTVVDGSNWEYGIGTINSSSQLARTQVLNSSSGAGTAITLAAGTKTVRCAINPQACLNNGTGIFGNGDTTPSVPLCRVWFASNTGGTTITNFDDGIEGEDIAIIFTNSNTTIQHNANIRLSGGANFTGTANDTMRLMVTSNVWYELSRSVNT